jgi:hypothetical protein
LITTGTYLALGKSSGVMSVDLPNHGSSPRAVICADQSHSNVHKDSP